MNFLSIKKRSFLAQSLFFVAQLFLTASLFADVVFTTPLTTVASLGYGKDVLLVKDAQDKQFILKYNTKSNYITANTEPSIHEALGAKIGMDAGININDVQLFPAHDTSLQSIDINPDVPKTLHTVVPGKEVCNSEMPYHVNIQLSASNGAQNLQSLTYHKNLCHIAALDLFTSNIDRHNGNLFFDTITNQFYAIDMDWIFNDIYHIPNDTHDIDVTVYSYITDFIQSCKKKPFQCRVLATEICKLLRNIKPESLTSQEIEALKEVNTTLQKLQSLYSPKKLFNAWMNIAQQAHYTYSIQKQQYIRYLIAYNYCEITKVRAEINRILSDNSVSSYMQQMKDHATIAWQTATLQSNLIF